MIKIIITDDHTIIREGLSKILAKEIDFKIVGEAVNAAELLKLVQKVEYDIITLDISLPDKSGLDAIKDLIKINPKVKILILSMHPENKFALRAIQYGALGYITKESEPAEIVNAIRKVHSGRRYVSESLVDILTEKFTEDKEVPHERLSTREFEIFMKLASGKKISDIAKELFLSISTINTYRTRILEKMEFSSNIDLMQYAMKNKLIE